MRALSRLTATEIRLFLREPVTVIFTLALPLMVLYVLGGVFGNELNPGEETVYRGYGPTDFYTPAYVALAVAGIALIGLPTHMVEYRETGVLRRFRASSVERGTVLGSQLIVTIVVATVGSVLLVVAAFVFTEVSRPVSIGGVLLAYSVGVLAITMLGLLLGTVLPTARAAQSVGLLLWFLFMFVSGAGPPPEVLPSSLQTLGDWAPLTPVVELLQEPWLSGEWAGRQSLVAGSIALVCGVVAWFAFRWE